MPQTFHRQTYPRVPHVRQVTLTDVVLLLPPTTLREAYNPDEPRNARGEWGDDGATASGARVSRRRVSARHRRAEEERRRRTAAKQKAAAEQKVIQQAQQLLGSQLHISNADDLQVQAALKSLSKLTPAAVAILKANGSQLYIGTTSLDKVNAPGLAAIVASAPNQQGEQGTAAQWGDVQGMTYMLPSGQMVSVVNVAAPVITNTNYPALYELGHAVGMIGPQYSSGWLGAYATAYPSLAPVYQQGGPGAGDGSAETFAGAFVSSLTDPVGGTKQWGAASMSYMQGMGF